MVPPSPPSTIPYPVPLAPSLLPLQLLSVPLPRWLQLMHGPGEDGLWHEDENEGESESESEGASECEGGRLLVCAASPARSDARCCCADHNDAAAAAALCYVVLRYLRRSKPATRAAMMAEKSLFEPR